METIFAGMSDAKVFAKIDLKEAYWQIPLDAKSREICTINTSKGLFQMTRLPKGMKNSSAIFQRVMESILKDIPNVIIYQDDILIYAPNSDILAKRVSSVTQRLDQKGVSINRAKSVINTPEVKFLGHLLSEDGIRPDPDITNKILSFKAPTDKSQLESFLGLTNFFGRMIENYSGIVQPLHNLRKKNTEFRWTDIHQAAFDKLLQIMASPPVLSSYDVTQPVTLTTDASEKAIGGILTQGGKPVMFVSRMCTPAEQRYSNIEREGLAVVWCVMRLKQLLLGKHFDLVTDHKPLLKIYGGRNLPKVASNRLVRWSILLQRFNFSIQHKPGSEITHADALTRMQLLSDPSEDEDLVINNSADDISDEWLSSIQYAMQGDELAKSIMKRVETNNWTHLKAQEKHFFRLRHDLSVDNQLLRLKHKCYIPPSLRKDVFDSCHNLHSGVHSTINHIKLTSWWPSLSSDVREWIRNCATCSKLRPSTKGELHSWPSEEPFQRLHLDWCHVPDIGELLIIVDSSSGWIEASLPQARTSQNVIDTLTAVFSRFGIPKMIVTDNAAEFTSRELNEFCTTNGIKKVESPPYHPQSNGPAERGVQTVKNAMKAWRLNVSHLPFRDYLRRILLHHRACCTRPDGKTPAELVFGRKIRVPLTRNFLFSQPINYRSRDGNLRDGTYLLERGSNTSWLLDAATNRLRLAHDDQVSRRPPASTEEVRPDLQPGPRPSPVFDPEETLPMENGPAHQPSSPTMRSSSIASPLVSQHSSPSARSPSVAAPRAPRSPRPVRNRQQKVITDYDDL